MSQSLIHNKILTKTDVARSLVWPSDKLNELLDAVGQGANVLDMNDPNQKLDFLAFDHINGGNWLLRCTIRSKGDHPKPVINQGMWQKVVEAHGLGVGDKVAFYRNHDLTIAAPIVFKVISRAIQN